MCSSGHLAMLNDDGHHTGRVHALLEISREFGCAGCAGCAGCVVIDNWPAAGVRRDRRKHQQCQSENSAPRCTERRGIELTAYASACDLRCIGVLHKFFWRHFRGTQHTDVLRAWPLVGNRAANRIATKCIIYNGLHLNDDPVRGDNLAQQPGSMPAVRGLTHLKQRMGRLERLDWDKVSQMAVLSSRFSVLSSG